MSLCSTLVACGKHETKRGSAQAAPSVPTSPTQSVAPPPVPNVRACKFVRIDRKKDASAWDIITAAFRQELRADEVGTTSNDPAGQYAHPVKRIALMASCGDAVIVALEKRSGKKDEDWNRLVELYNFNLSRKEKSIIEAKWQFWLWTYRKLARFDDSPVPDIVFESASCTECEPEFVLSAVRYDADNQKWGLRLWPEGGEGVVIADTDVDVDGSVEEYRMLAGIADFEHVGHDEIAVWTHYRDVDDKDPKHKLPAVTTLHLYRCEKGVPRDYEIKDEAEKNRITKVLRQMNSRQKLDKLGRPSADDR